MTGETPVRARKSWWRNSKLGRLLASAKKAPPLLPMLIAVALVVAAVFANWLAPHSPIKGDLVERLLPPSWMDGGISGHLLGTDKFGRDVLSRLIYGARISLTLSLLTIVVSGFVGTSVGLIAGYFGGAFDTVLMRLADAALSFPLILIAIVLAVVVGPSYANIILILALLLWPRYARQIRGETLAVKEQDFVALARVAGCSHFRIITRHLLPNLIPTLLVLATLQVGYVIVLESSLSFLGVGIPPPTPAWGVMVADGKEYLRSAWWLSTFPGAAILLTVLSMNLLGDWTRDQLDPKLRQV